MSELCYAVHVDGGQEVGGLTLPTYGNAGRAVHAAGLLKRSDPDALVTLVVWFDGGEDGVARTLSETHDADKIIAQAATSLQVVGRSTVPDEPFGYDPAG